jgi:GAF domain-containing protein
VHLVASYEDPGIRNHVVDLSRYPELRRALETGEVVSIPDAIRDPSLSGVFAVLTSRRVRSIMVVPMSWRGVSIGAIFLRTFRDGPELAEQEVEFCRVVADLTAQALRQAHRVERLRARKRGGEAEFAAEKERAAMLGFLRRFLLAFSERDGTRDEGLLARASTAELDRLVGVALTVLTNEAQVK